MSGIIGIDPIDLGIMLLASARLSYLIASDEITRPLREVVYRHSSPLHAKNVDGEPWRMIESFKSTRRELDRGFPKWQHEFEPTLRREPGWIAVGLECSMCVGFWVTHAVLAAYIVFGDAVAAALLPIAAWYVVNWLSVRL